MPRFFRKLRIGSMSKKSFGWFFGYAIGELLLVIAGILIALQLNLWNTERLETNRTREYAHGLIQDLKQDMDMLVPILKEMDGVRKRVAGLAEYMQDRPLSDIRNIDLFYFMHEPFYRPFSWNRSSFERLNQSGALQSMKNRALANKISAYTALTLHLDEDFEYDRSMGKKAAELANRVVNMNSPHLPSVLLLDGFPEYDFPNSEIHDAYSNIEMDLLANNLQEIQIAVNSYLQLDGVYGLRPRLTIEMPTLQVQANELIQMLESEYR